MSALYYFAAILEKSKTEIPMGDFTSGSVATIIKIALSIAAGIAVLIIALSGFRYVTSQGDSAGLAKAKDGIIYAVIGLVIAMSGVAIVSFVTGRL